MKCSYQKTEKTFTVDSGHSFFPFPQGEIKKKRGLGNDVPFHMHRDLQQDAHKRTVKEQLVLRS